MAACGSLEHIFEKPFPDNPTLLESLSSWKPMKSINNDSSFTEIFGELHFKEHHVPSLSPSSSRSSSLSSNSTNSTDVDQPRLGIDIPQKDKNRTSTFSYCPSSHKKQYRHSDSFSSMNSESLSMCTEGLGFESSDDVEDVLSNDDCNYEFKYHQEERKSFTRNTTENHVSESKRSKTCSRGAFPPPISCIGRSGKPWVCFKSYREDGRFILKEIRIPTQEFLQACRENGRLKLRFIHSESDDEILEGDKEEEEDEDEDEEESNKEKNKDTRGDDDKRESEEERKNGEENVKTNNCNVKGSS